MAAIVQAQANSVLAAILAQSTVGATTGIKTRLTTGAVPTSTTAATELAGGGGYTTGGTVTTWNVPASGQTTNITVLAWPNSSGSPWSITGLELWDQAGSPLRWLYGTWAGGTITIASGNTFQVTGSAITITLA